MVRKDLMYYRAREPHVLVFRTLKSVPVENIKLSSISAWPTAMFGRVMQLPSGAAVKCSPAWGLNGVDIRRSAPSSGYPTGRD